MTRHLNSTNNTVSKETIEIAKLIANRRRKNNGRKQLYRDFIGALGELIVGQYLHPFGETNCLKDGHDGGVDITCSDWTIDVKTTAVENPHLVLRKNYKFKATYVVLVQIRTSIRPDIKKISQIPDDPIEFEILGWTDEDSFKKKSKLRNDLHMMKTTDLSVMEIMLDSCQNAFKNKKNKLQK